MKSALENFEAALNLKKREMAALEEIRIAKLADKGGALRKMLECRLSITENTLMVLDTSDPRFGSLYDRSQAVRDEYRLLLNLLASADKRIEKVKDEIAKLMEEIGAAKKTGEALRQQF